MQKLVTPAEVPPKGVPVKVIRSASAGSELLVGQQTIYEMLQYDRLNSSYGPNLYLILTPLASKQALSNAALKKALFRHSVEDYEW